MPARAPAHRVRVLILRKEVKRRTGIRSDTTLWTWVKTGTFPQPVILNPGSKSPRLVWFEDEIAAWIASRPRGIGVGPAQEVYAARTAQAEARLGHNGGPPIEPASPPPSTRVPSAAPPSAAQEADAPAPAPRPVLLSREERERLAKSGL